MQSLKSSLDRMVEYWTQRLSRTPDGDPFMRLVLRDLGGAHAERFDHLNHPDDIHKAIEYTTIALTLTRADGDDDLQYLLHELGIIHEHRFKLLGDIHDLGKVIEYTSLELEMLPDDYPNLPHKLANLAVSYKDRFERLGKLDDIEKALKHDCRAVALTPNDDSELPIFLEMLGTSHIYRFQHLGELDDLQKAIDCQSRGVELVYDGHSRFPAMLGNLAVSHIHRFKRLGDLGDLEKAIQHESRALDLTPHNHPLLSSRFANLGAYQVDRFRRLGELKDLERAIEYGSRALALTPDGHPEFPGRLSILGAIHINRFERLGELNDLKQAIEYNSRAILSTPDGHPDLPSRLANLGLSHSQRFERLGELNDLEQAIEYKSRAISLTPDGHSSLSSRLADIGVLHMRRFKRLGELDNLEQAIEYQSRALVSTPDDHPDLSKRLANLGVFHNHLYRRLGELSDLEQSIEYLSRAVTLTLDDNPELLSRLQDLGVSLRYRFMRLGGLNDLERAIEHQSRVLSLTPDGHPDFSGHLVHLGLSHKHRFQRLGELSDIEQAIEYQSRALSLIPDGHPEVSTYLADLGGSYICRFRHLGDLGDLNETIECESRALELTSDDQPHTCLIHFNLAISYVLYHERTNSPIHLGYSLNSFRLASRSLVGAPREKFQCAHTWAACASKHEALNPIEAYQTAIELLPQFIWFGTTTTQRYDDLKNTATLAVDAATAAIVSSNYSQALEWLEHTRCVVWNQILMLRSPVDQLVDFHPDLATRLRIVSQQLHSASSELRESRVITDTSMSPEQVGQQHRRLAKEYDKLLSKARSLPGLADFLQPMKASGLVCAARIGPVIAINCHKDRCDALVILPEQSNVACLPLPNFSAKKAQDAFSTIQKSLRSKDLRERGVHIRRESGDRDGFKKELAMLWDDVVKPTLDYLGYTTNVMAENLPHITWCPTGAASFLPFHAAGDYDQPHSRVFDYAISSYTPTLTALLASTPSTLGPSSRFLFIGQEATPGHKPLPGIKTEVKHVKSHVENKARYSQLMGAQATSSAVLDAMEQHDWVHLACHAHQDIYEPTKSGFFLHNDTLDLPAINARSFKKKGLAFLSACQTATGDETLPDEAVHLASGMLMAGYSSVIATMWSVVDQDAPFVADKVYGELMKEGKLGNGEAGKALHNAVAVLREKVGEKEFERWVPYIHIGS